MTTDLSRQKATQYLRDAAIRSHLDGQGAKARQLAILSLRQEAQRRSIPILPLKDLGWAFFLTIFWMLKEEDYSIALDGAWEAFNSKQTHEGAEEKKSDDDHWYKIIGFLMDVLRPTPSKWDSDIISLEDIPISFFTKKDDQYLNEILCMLLPFVIDFVHYIYPDKKAGRSNSLIWHSLCQQWESKIIQSQNGNLQKALSTTRERIEKQYACIFKSGAFSNNAGNALEELWEAFYKNKKDKMKTMLPQLTKLAYGDKDQFYTVQNVVNMTRFMLGWESDQIPGVYRIQRLYMENSQWLFDRLRITEFSEVLNDAYFEARETGTESLNNVQIWRMPLISEIIALRNWDLLNYIRSITMQSKAWLFRGLFPVDYKKMSPRDCNSEDLIKGIYQAVKGFVLEGKKERHFNDVERAFRNLELNEKSNINIDGLIELLIHSLRPIENRSAVYLFGIMSDAIPKNRLKSVFKISIAAFFEKRIGFDFGMLDWWEDVFEWVDLDKTDWDMIVSVLDNMFQNPRYWMSCNGVLKGALIKAPSELAVKWANIISGNSDKDNLRQYGIPIIYNASLERDELKEYALQILDILKKDPSIANQMEYDRALLLAADEERRGIYETSAGKKYRLNLIENLLRYAQSIANRNVEPRHVPLRLPFQSQPFRRINWRNLPQKEWLLIDEAFKTAIENPYMTGMDFRSLILVWSIIASAQKRAIVNDAGKWLIETCKNLQITTSKPDIPSYWQRLMIPDVKDGIRVALSRFLYKVSPSISDNMLAWIQDEIPDAESGTQPLLWEMLFALYITGTHKQSIWVLNALKAIFARTVDNTQLLTEIAERSYNVFITPYGKNNSRLIDALNNKNDKDIDSILNTLDKIIGKLVEFPNPDGRRSTAMLLSLFLEMGWITEQRGKWIEKLKKDPRARVFTVFSEVR